MALEIGTDGILGGQAKVEGVEGTWMHLHSECQCELDLDSIFTNLLFFPLANGINFNPFHDSIVFYTSLTRL